MTRSAFAVYIDSIYSEADFVNVFYADKKDGLP